MRWNLAAWPTTGFVGSSLPSLGLSVGSQGVPIGFSMQLQTPTFHPSDCSQASGEKESRVVVWACP